MREEEKRQSSRKIGKNSFFKKRWVYPAVYIAAAAIILTSFLYFQGRGNDNATDNELGYQEHSERAGEQDAIEVNAKLENFKWPVANADAVEVKTPFYDTSASQEELEAAILTYGNSFQPNTGLAIGAKDGETFDVLAAMSGTVQLVEEDAVLGNVIVIEHAEGIETRYQSVQDIQVAVGDTVNQGDVIAKAGRSLLNEDAGVHVHFEIRNNNDPVNPLRYFEKNLASLQNSEAGETAENASEEETTDTEQNEEAGNSEEAIEGNEESQTDANSESEENAS